MKNRPFCRRMNIFDIIYNLVSTNFGISLTKFKSCLWPCISLVYHFCHLPIKDGDIKNVEIIFFWFRRQQTEINKNCQHESRKISDIFGLFVVLIFQIQISIFLLIDSS